MALSYSQFETLDALFGRVDRALNTFDAYHVFDQRNNEDNGHRRTSRHLRIRTHKEIGRWQSIR